MSDPKLAEAVERLSGEHRPFTYGPWEFCEMCSAGKPPMDFVYWAACPVRYVLDALVSRDDRIRDLEGEVLKLKEDLALAETSGDAIMEIRADLKERYGVEGAFFDDVVNLAILKAEAAANERAEQAEAALREFHLDIVSSHKPEHCLNYCRQKEAALAAAQSKISLLEKDLDPNEPSLGQALAAANERAEKLESAMADHLIQCPQAHAAVLQAAAPEPEAPKPLPLGHPFVQCNATHEHISTMGIEKNGCHWWDQERDAYCGQPESDHRPKDLP